MGSPRENADPAFFRLNNNLEEEDESKMAKLVDEKELFKGI